MIFDWMLMIDVFFLKKLDQINVYEDWSTIFDDVKKWSNECDVRMLHLMPMSSNALTIVSMSDCCTSLQNDQMKNSWCSNCCIWSRWDQMHWRLNIILILLHLMSMSSNALTKLFVDVRWLHSISNDQMHWRNYLLMSNDCIRFRTIKCTDEVVC